MAETPEKEPQAEAVNKATQLDEQPVIPSGRSSRMWAIVVCSLALGVSGAVAIYTLPEFNIALPNFSSFAELFPRAAASAPIADPAVTPALRDIQSSQQQNSATLQQNGAVLQQNAAIFQQGAATLESLRQNFTVQQTDLKRISNQLSSLMARVDYLQNAVTPLTTSTIPQSKARARVIRTSTKNVSRLPKPIGPVSVRGAPLSPTPAPGSGAGQVFGG